MWKVGRVWLTQCSWASRAGWVAGSRPVAEKVAAATPDPLLPLLLLLPGSTFPPPTSLYDPHSTQNRKYKTMAATHDPLLSPLLLPGSSFTNQPIWPTLDPKYYSWATYHYQSPVAHSFLPCSIFGDNFESLLQATPDPIVLLYKCDWEHKRTNSFPKPHNPQLSAHFSPTNQPPMIYTWPKILQLVNVLLAHHQ